MFQAFKPIEKGRTRVIVSTNIAESSVTIPNVTYVIDFGRVKEMVFQLRVVPPPLYLKNLSKKNGLKNL